MSKSEALLKKSVEGEGIHDTGGIRSCPPSSGCGDRTLQALDFGAYLGKPNPYQPLSSKYSKATLDQIKNQSNADSSESNSWRNSRIFRLFSCCGNPPTSISSDDNVVASIIVMPGSSVRIKDVWTPGNNSLSEISNSTTACQTAPPTTDPVPAGTSAPIASQPVKSNVTSPTSDAAD